MSSRECSHEFYCWYRLQGRCCHGSVENISTCKGHEPSTIYLELTFRPHRSISKNPPPETDSPPADAFKPYGVRAAI